MSGNGKNNKEEQNVEEIMDIGVENSESSYDGTSGTSRRSEDPDFANSSARSVAGSVISMTSSTGSSVRQRRLPPPPPVGDYSRFAKRPRTSTGEGDDTSSRTSHIEDDQMSLVSTNTVQENVPVLNHRILEEERRKFKCIKAEPERTLMTYDTLVLGRSIEAQESDAYVDTTFCSRGLLEELMNLKYRVRQVGTNDYRDVQRKMSNHGQGSMFYHTAAAIYANIDAVFKCCITSPKDVRSREPLLGPNELLYVVDLEGAPGGGCEYVLTRKQWEAKVYGFVNINEDYKIQGKGHFPPECMEQWLGHSNERGTGDIHNPEYINKFAAHVRKTTNNKGAHVVLAGGSINGPNVDEDRKELLIKNVAEAETLIALKVLRDGGTFILKLYDMFTSYTVGLVFLLYRTFEQVTIYRPESCTHGSSERYAICLGYKNSPLTRNSVTAFLENCVQTEFMSRAGGHFNDDKAEIMLLVPTEILRDTSYFYDYVYNMNQEVGERQLKETREIIRAITNGEEDAIIRLLRDTIESKLRNVWGVPSELRQTRKYEDLDATETARKLLKPYSESELAQSERSGESDLFYDTVKGDLLSPKEWHYVHVGRDRGFYLSKGGNKVYRFINGVWKLVNDELDIVANTLVYADIVDEISQYDGKQIVKVGMHIIDGLVLGGRDIRNLPYVERSECCEKFAASINKVMADKLLLVRAKAPKFLTAIGDSFRGVHKRQILGRGDCKKKPLVPVDCAKYNNVIPDYALTGYLLLKTSKSNNSACDFLCTMQNRVYMRINDDSNMDPHGPVPEIPPNPRRTRMEAAALINYLQQRGSTTK